MHSTGRFAFRPTAITLAILAFTAIVLRVGGRRWWCACGSPVPWTLDAYSPHTSQHLLDPYSFSHVIHGVLLCALLRYTAPRLPVAWRLVIAILVEASWELLENSPTVISRYRAATAALGYEGDSILNSLADITCMIAGFALARRLPWRASLATIVVFEVGCLFWIRDNLTLNVIMLVHPIPAIREWQSALAR